MKRIVVVLAMALGMAAGVCQAQDEGRGEGRAIVTVLPKNDAQAVMVDGKAAVVTVGGKKAEVKSWRALTEPGDGVELVVLMDTGSRDSLGSQLEGIGKFLERLPPNVRATVAYMQNGTARLAGPLTDDRAEVRKHLHAPLGGTSASPYFCLSDLAKSWPGGVVGARHVVVMVTDGIDPYQEHFDPEDQYLQTAIRESVRAGLQVYALYWKSRGNGDDGSLASNDGQSLLQVLTEATGGKNFWHGQGNPVSFEPYLDELLRRLRNQYELGFTAPLKGKPDAVSIRVKLQVPGASVDAPQGAGAKGRQGSEFRYDKSRRYQGRPGRQVRQLQGTGGRQRRGMGASPFRDRTASL